MNGLFLLHYLPPIEWFVYWLSCDNRIIERCDNFQKSSYRNRCYIASPHGEQLLSVPLQSGKHQKKKYREVSIAFEHQWQKNHLRSIEAAYRSSPYFEFYEDEFAPFYATTTENLFDFNLQLLTFLFKSLQIEADFKFTEKYEIQPVHTDLRNVVIPATKTSSRAIQEINYIQVFGDKTGFIPGLSIIDLLFNEGPASIEILQRAANELKIK